MTTNAGSDIKLNTPGFASNEINMAVDRTEKALEGFLRPEFIARVDEIVVFNPLDTETLTGIAGLMLGELKDALKDKLIDFKYDKKLCEYLALKCDSAKRGARDLRNLIRRELENKIVDIIVESSEGSIKAIEVKAKDKIDFKVINVD